MADLKKGDRVVITQRQRFNPMRLHGKVMDVDLHPTPKYRLVWLDWNGSVNDFWFTEDEVDAFARKA